MFLMVELHIKWTKISSYLRWSEYVWSWWTPAFGPSKKKMDEAGKKNLMKAADVLEVEPGSTFRLWWIWQISLAVVNYGELIPNHESKSWDTLWESAVKGSTSRICRSQRRKNRYKLWISTMFDYQSSKISNSGPRRVGDSSTWETEFLARRGCVDMLTCPTLQKRFKHIQTAYLKKKKTQLHSKYPI